MTSLLRRRGLLKTLLGLVAGNSLYRTFSASQKHEKCSTGADDEGPYYLSEPPWRDDLTIDYRGKKSDLLLVKGSVVTDCDVPVSGAIVDVWHASPEGEYNMDKKAYLFRGRVKTDQSGNYAFKTMLPAAYPGRPKHIHFKVYTETGQSLTTQLYFEGDPKTRKDYLYNRNKGIDRTVVLKKNANGLESNFKIHLA